MQRTWDHETTADGRTYVAVATGMNRAACVAYSATIDPFEPGVHDRRWVPRFGVVWRGGGSCYVCGSVCVETYDTDPDGEVVGNPVGCVGC